MAKKREIERFKNMDDFAQKVSDAVIAQLSEQGIDAEVNRNTVDKLNDKYEALTIKKKGDNVGAHLNLEKMFNNVIDCEMTFDEVVNGCCKAITNMPFDSNIGETLKSYENVKSRLRLRVVNEKDNAARLEQIAYVKFLDLAVVPYVLISDYDDNEKITAAVTNDMVGIWGVGINEIVETAKSNTAIAEEFKFESLIKYTSELIGVEVPIEDDDCTNVLIGNSKLNGAAAITMTQLFKKFAKEKDSDLLIIPCSVHELIVIVAKNVSAKYEELVEMVKTVNATELKPEDVLSDNVYIYSRETDDVRIAEGA